MAESWREKRKRELAGTQSSSNPISWREQRRQDLQKNQLSASGIDNEVRALAPELFSPQQNLNAFNQMVKPVAPVQQQAQLPSVVRQPAQTPQSFVDLQNQRENLFPSIQPAQTPTVSNLSGASTEPWRYEPKTEMSRQEWIANEKANRAADVVPGYEWLAKASEFPATLIDYAQAYTPGVPAFQQGAGSALNIQTQTAPVKGPEMVNDIAGGAGAFAGFATNPAALEQGLIQGGYKIGNLAIQGTKTGQKLTNVGQNALTKSANAANPVLNKAGMNVGRNITDGLAERGLVGAAAGAVQGAALSGVRDETDAGQVFKSALLGAAGGGAGDVAISGLGRAFMSLLKKNNVPEEVIQEVLALPAPKQRGNANIIETPSVITDYTGPKNGLPAPKMEPPTSARISKQSNSYRDQFEELMQRAQKLQSEGRFTPGREDADLESLWGQMAGREGVGLDELIQRAYPPQKSKVTTDLVQNAKMYQESREVAGAPLPVKSRADRLKEAQGVVANAEAPIQKVGRSPQAEVLPAQTQPGRPRTEVNPEVINSQPKRTTIAQEVDDIVAVVNKPRIRDRMYDYLDEAEKAARGRIAKRRNRLSANPLDEWGDHAIVMAAQVGKGTIKTADFTEALVKEFGESIRPKAGAILRRTKEVLREQERKASKEGQAAEKFNNSGLGDADSFEKKITRGKKADKGSFEDKWEKLKTQFTEDVAPINRLERNVTGKISSAEDSIYKSSRLYKGVPEKINQYIDTKLKPIVRNVEKAGYNSDDLGRYALAVHAKDVNAAGYKSGFTNAEIDDVISKFNTTEMEAARQKLVNINRELLDDLVNSGVVSKEMRDVLNERWKNYIPLFRDVDDVAGRSSGLSEALANVASPIKKLKGSEKNVIEPLENMITSITKNINAAERNKVASHITRLSKIDTDQRFIRKLDEGEKIDGKNVVSVKENGDTVHYEVDEDVRDAMLRLDKESSTALIRFLSTPASWLRAGATLTPEFMVRNPIRDYRNARIISDSGFKMSDYAVGMASSIMGKFGKGKLYQDWIENLGAYGNIVSEDKNLYAAAQRKVLTEKTSKKFVNIINPKSFISLLRNISDVTESATKVGEYRAAIRSGASKEEAAYRSRDIMDFARAGTSIRQANKIIAFLNANIQGKSRTIRAFKNNPVRTSARIFQHMVVPTIGIHYYNKQFANDKQQETIKNAPDWQRNTFWLVAIPNSDMVARIPKPFDFAVVSNVVDRSLDFFADNDKEAFDGFAKGVLADNALPMMITGLQPLYEGGADHSFFKQSSIIPQRDARLAFEDQYDPIRTSETAKVIAKGVESTLGSMGGNFRSPYIIDNTIQGLFAGGGKYVTDAVDAILGKIEAVDRPTAPEKRAEQAPVSRSFLVDPLQGGKGTEKFYAEREKLSREKTSADINDREFPNEDRLDYLNDVYSDMSEIGKEIREIERGDGTAKFKRDQIEPLMKERNRLAQEAVKAGVAK